MTSSATSEPKLADVVIRARKIYTNIPDFPTQRAIAIRGALVSALSPDQNGLEELVGPDTKILTLPDATILPSFDDTRSHLIFAGLGQFDVPVHTAKNMAQLLQLLQESASKAEPGKWISTTTNWQEFNLPEKRFPTAQELDKISKQHPIIVTRGGHNIVANSVALRLAGITTTTEPPPGGKISQNEK